MGVVEDGRETSSAKALRCELAAFSDVICFESGV